MGDAGEGLVDNKSKIQELMEERQRNREQARKPQSENPELAAKIESLQLARKEMTRQLGVTTHDARRKQINGALVDLDRRIEEMQKQSP